MGLINLLIGTARRDLYSIASFKLPNHLMKYLALLIFFLYFFRGLNYQNHIYESHDLVYFSWIQEMITSQYTGAIKVGVAWPHLMAANHLLPGSMLAVLSIFLGHSSLVTSIEIRYLLVTLSFTTFFYTLLPHNATKTIVAFFFCILIFSIYREELAYDLNISSFAYVIIILEILKGALLQKGDDRSLIFFSIILIIAKAPIFFIAGLMAAWFYYMAPASRFSTAVIFASFLVVFNLASWALVSPPVGESIQWNLVSPLRISNLVELRNWVIPNNITAAFQSYLTNWFVPIAFTLYILVKYYGTYFLISRKFASEKLHSKFIELNVKIRLRGLSLYMLASLFAWLFIRNGQTVAHQSHAFQLAAVFTMATLMCFIVKFSNKYGYFVICVLSLILSIRLDITNPFSYVQVATLSSSSAVRYHEIIGVTRINASGFYAPPEGESYGRAQVMASMLGLRLAEVDNSLNGGKNSQLQYWIRP